MRIGIIGGGGAGCSAAWLLEQNHEVTLYERHPKLGGHAHTIDVEHDGHITHVSDGFNWLSDEIYPRTMRLFELVGVKTTRVPMSASFTDTRGGACLTMPPVGAQRLFQLITSPRQIWLLSQFGWAVKKAERIVYERKTETTAQEFVESLPGTAFFKNEFLMPFMSAVWGCPWDRTGDCSIYPLMKYIVFHKPSAFSYYYWHIVKGGANAYIRQLATTLDRTTVRTDAQVTAIRRQEEGGFEVTTAAGSESFDHLIVATGAHDAQRLLADTAGIDLHKEAVGGFEYYLAHVATHTDTRVMPTRKKDWCVANVLYDGKAADLTIWAGWDSGARVFNSYVQPGTEYEGTRHISGFWLPLETPAHFRAQKALKAVQGQDNLWFAGDYTQDIGSHEDAVRSAIDIALKLAPDSERLAAILQDRSPPGQLAE